jgi:hypothetical protein
MRMGGERSRGRRSMRGRSRSREGGSRSGWDGERPDYPENAVARRPPCKMQQLLPLLLEPLQCASLRHFAGAEADPADVGDRLTKPR